MALSSTINKVNLSISDTDRHYYHTHDLTVAQHPSETDYRFLIRLLVFSLNASDTLTFSKGLSTDDEPDLWQKNLTDDIELWVDLGQPDEKRIRKACGRADRVKIYTYHERKASVWWEQQQSNLQRFDNLQVFHVQAEGIEAVMNRSMQLLCNIQDGELFLSDETNHLTVNIEQRK